MTLNPKQAVKEWLSEQWEKRVKEPIDQKTEELENQALGKLILIPKKPKKLLESQLIITANKKLFIAGYSE